MFDTRSALLEKIRLGEDSFLELKEVRFASDRIKGPTQEQIADEMSAFANSAGGVLLLGVADTREILGIPLKRLDAVELLVQQACENAIKPPLMPIIERITLPDIASAEQPILRIEIARSLFVHQSPKGYLQRIGSSKRPIPPDQLARLFQQRSQSRMIRFDEIPVPRALLTDLEETLWRRFIPTRNDIHTPEILLPKLAMAQQDEHGIWRPTVAGVLMACDAPQRFLPCAYIQAVAYFGNSTVPPGSNAYQRDAQDITGSLDQQILKACAFVQKNMQITAHKSSQGGRQDLPQFDLLAVFEALTNAVAHRDYSIGGAKVRVRLFRDRLEIYSPGMLPNTMTTESLAFRQVARNEALTSLLARCTMENTELPSHRRHFMDKRGEGVPIILEAGMRLSGRRPEYQLYDDSELLLTIYSAPTEETTVS